MYPLLLLLLPLAVVIAGVPVLASPPMMLSPPLSLSKFDPFITKKDTDDAAASLLSFFVNGDTNEDNIGATAR